MSLVPKAFYDRVIIRKIEEDALRDGQLQQDLSALKMSLAAISN